MGKILLLVEHDGQKISPAGLACIELGRQTQKLFGGTVSFLLLGYGLESVLKDASRYGADEVLFHDSEQFKHLLAEPVSQLMARLVSQENIQYVFGTATSVGKDILPRVAGLIDAAYVSDLSVILPDGKFKRLTHAGNLWQTVQVKTSRVVGTCRKTDFAMPDPVDKITTPREISFSNTRPDWVEVEHIESQQKNRPELTDAQIVISGGRGMREKKNFEYLGEICDVIGAALGASRAACDAGMAPYELQVGQTGKVVAPKLYIAVALSGAIQHVAGMKKSKVIVAINKDPQAPIFEIADYGLVGTWETQLPLLLEEFKALNKNG